jgi:hypothetical protein
VLARLMRLAEVNEVLDTLRRRSATALQHAVDRTYDERVRRLAPRSVAHELQGGGPCRTRSGPATSWPDRYHLGRPARREPRRAVLPGPRRLARPVGGGAHHPRRRRRARLAA